MLEKKFGNFLFASLPDKSRTCPRYIEILCFKENDQNIIFLTSN